MRRTTQAVFFSLLTFAIPVDADEASTEPGGQHGVFTGEMKPVVYVTNVEEAAPFYRDVLGFDFLGFAGKEEDPYYAEMAAAGIKFGLHEPIWAGQESKIGEVRLYFRVRDLAAHRARGRGARRGSG